MTSVQENCSKDASTPNMLPSSLSSSPWLLDVHASTLGFMVSKYVMRRGITTFKSYFKKIKLHSHIPTKFSQFIMIWIRDPTWWQTCYELGLNNFFKTRENVSKPWHFVLACLFGKGKVLNELGLEFLSHLKPTIF